MLSKILLLFFLFGGATSPPRNAALVFPGLKMRAHVRTQWLYCPWLLGPSPAGHRQTSLTARFDLSFRVMHSRATARSFRLDPTFLESNLPVENYFLKRSLKREGTEFHAHEVRCWDFVQFGIIMRDGKGDVDVSTSKWAISDMIGLTKTDLHWLTGAYDPILDENFLFTKLSTSILTANKFNFDVKYRLDFFKHHPVLNITFIVSFSREGDGLPMDPQLTEAEKSPLISHSFKS